MPTPHVDFHRALAALGDQPALLRALGLLVDLELGDAEVDAGSIPSSGWVSVIDTEATPGWQLEPLDVTPRTRYASIFTAQPKTRDLDGGFLELGAGFGLVEVDVEGAALKLMNLANTVAASLYTRHRTADTPNRFSLPAPARVDSLVRSGRAQKLVKRLSRLQQLESDAGAATPAKSDLSAEDLIRGYRADVKDADDPDATWLSLCRRLLSYQVGEGAARMPWPPDGQPPIEEGWPTARRDLRRRPLDGARSDGHGVDVPMDGVEPLCASPREAHWHRGCPRAVSERVRRGIRDGPQARDGRSRPSGVAPRLRFGHRYLVRVRAADLAGNGLPGRMTAPRRRSAPRRTRFRARRGTRRRATHAPGAGESLERIVIRSFNDEPDKDDDATTETVDRHIAPQLVSQLLAEQHGMFDAMSPADSYVLVQSRQGTYDQDDAEEGAATVPHPEAQLPPPYLPDPAWPAVPRPAT